ncbi:hypothetical protein EYF80_060410 [Liparis tanakae]|uniref:Uncharacterized protein n=1 Tax=Liparis tanakae TaxID=230148 RepID=A0A4Z2ELX7_9TELE|nr:hypothetical protein EYF80_060410 [Liparis tanakae]
MIFFAYFLVPPQDLVPYQQGVVRVMGAAALGLDFYCEGTDRMHEFLPTGGEKRRETLKVTAAASSSSLSISLQIDCR